MNYGKRIALSRPTPVTDSDSALGDDFDDDSRFIHKRPGAAKDKMNRNLSEKKRRDQFNMLVNELCTMVSTNNKKMDKSTVLKSTIAFLKNYQETTDQAHIHEINEDWKPSFLTNDEFMHLMLEALDSFLLLFTQQGTILYASESVTSLLGHLPSDLTNKSIYDFVQESEKSSVHNVLYSVANRGQDPDGDAEENQLCFDCSFRRGHVDPREHARYEAITVKGSFRRACGSTDDDDSAAQRQFFPGQICFCSTVRLKTSQLVREMSVVDDNKEFTSRHSLEWKFLFLDHRAPPIIGYLPFEVLGTSGYDYYHPDDLDNITTSHEQLMKTGEGTSCFYRFLIKGQQWIWLKTHYFITYHQWNSKPEFISCTNTVVSYADVRRHKRKELGLLDNNAQHADDDIIARRMPSSPSVGSVTSGGRLGSTWSLSPVNDENTDHTSVCGLSDRGDSVEATSNPSSTSQQRTKTVSEHLQEYLQRHQQASQSSTVTSHSQPTTSAQAATPSYSTLSLQQLLYRRQQQQQQKAQQQQQVKTSTPSHQRVILPRPAPVTNVEVQIRPSMCTLPSVAPPQPSTSSESGLVTVVSNTDMALANQRNVYMTPIQRQLHEQLQRKARQVQDAIQRQQEELRQITQQLTFSQTGAAVQIPLLYSNQENILGVMGGVQPAMPATATVSLQQPNVPQQQQQQQQYQQQQQHPQQQQQQQQQQQVPALASPQAQGVAANISSPNYSMLVDQSPFLPFPVLSNDNDVFLSLANSPDINESNDK